GLYKVRRLDEDRVFLLNGKPIRSIRTAFANACERAGIEGYRFHDFRHTCLSNLRLAGIDHLTMMKWSGHKTMDVFKRYQSFSEENLRESAKLLTRRLTLAQQPIEETIAK
ncbi:MAG TPA: tyrosine-type recombinase/integrase, partial [Nitrospiraceae bacterium]|nr:tyrosine-type recombinase/integrase [Nitrospiraceae bacterium]